MDSYEKWGIDRIPTIHLGSNVHAMEKKGIRTDRGDINRQIQEANREKAEIDTELALLEKEKEELKVLDDKADYYSKVNEEVRSIAETLEPEMSPYQDRPSSAGQQLQNRFSEQQQQNRLRSPKRTVQQNRPPPLRRQTREDRPLAGERSRQRSQGKRTQTHHTRTENAENRRKTEYDSLYENPPAKQGQEPENHSRDPSVGREQKTGFTDFDTLYEKTPPKKDQKTEHHSPDHSGVRERKTGFSDFDTLYEEKPDKKKQESEHHSHVPSRGLNRKTDFDRAYEKPDNGTNDHLRPERNRDGPEKET